MAKKENMKKHKKALITGAARRLGRATALGLARSGYDVALHFRTSGEAAEELAGEIRALGVQAWTVRAELADPGQAGALVGKTLDLTGSLDALVNNASIFAKSSVSDFTLDDLNRNMTVNAFSPLALARAFAGQEREGVIVNLLDSRIADYDREHAAYHLSKRTLFSLTRMLAVELAPRVRVNGVAPGLILPPAGEDETYLEKRKHTNPLGRYGQAEDVAEAVRFLVESRFITGQVIFVDGGRHLKGSVYG